MSVRRFVVVVIVGRSQEKGERRKEKGEIPAQAGMTGRYSPNRRKMRLRNRSRSGSLVGIASVSVFSAS